MDADKRVTIKSIRVRIKTTDGTTFRGKLNLDSETTAMDRVSDYFTRGSHPFITLYDVTAQGSNTLFVINKAHIVWVTPEEI